jgi:hypothetical protein
VSYGDLGNAPTPEPLSLVDQEKLKTGDDKWSTAYAKRIVTSDFSYAEYYRTHSHDWRYRNASELYLAWVGQKYWDGTRVPRSSIGVPAVFIQVESILPKIVSAICDMESYNFYPLISSQDDEALAWKRMILDQLAETNWREHIRRCCKSSLVYGNGILETGVEDYVNETVEFSQSHRATSWSQGYHPTVGPMRIPQQIVTDYSRKTIKETKVRPYLRYVSIIDFYVDPNCESTFLSDAGYVIKRVYMTAGQLKELRGKKDFDIPDDATLANYSHSKSTANQDVTKLSSELFRYNLWNPAQDYSSDPAQKRVEVIEYTTKDRKVWMLNREHVAYNKKNKYGKINYHSMHYADVLDRWHALAVSDVVEGDQRLQQAIKNARIDELALGIHRPMIKRRGVTIPAYQLRIRPGVVIETETPDQDIKQMEVQDITQNAYIETQASEQMVSRITGASDVAAIGIGATGNSANRTATGVNTQAGATQDRMRYYIENAESLVIEPVLNDFIDFDKRFLDMKEAALWLKQDPDFQKLDPVDVMNCRVKAECRASIKLAARQNFLQMLPQISQVLLNPELLTLVAQQQKKAFDAMEFERMVWDALNYSPRNPLFVDMTDEQKQAMQLPPPAERAKALIAAGQTKSNESIHDKQNITKMLTQILKDSFKHAGVLAKLDDEHLHHLIDTAMQGQQMQQDAQQPESDNEAS